AAAETPGRQDQGSRVDPDRGDRAPHRFGWQDLRSVRPVGLEPTTKRLKSATDRKRRTLRTRTFSSVFSVPSDIARGNIRCVETQGIVAFSRRCVKWCETRWGGDVPLRPLAWWQLEVNRELTGVGVERQDQQLQGVVRP